MRLVLYSKDGFGGGRVVLGDKKWLVILTRETEALSPIALLCDTV